MDIIIALYLSGCLTIGGSYVYGLISKSNPLKQAIVAGLVEKYGRKFIVMGFITATVFWPLLILRLIFRKRTQS